MVDRLRTHSMEVRGKVNRLTRVKPPCGHRADSRRLGRCHRLAGRGKETFHHKRDDSHAHKVTDDFELGAGYTIRFEVADGKVRYRFNGDLVPFTLSSSASTCYFKAGNYL
jgi:hypothetical protein